MYFNIVLFSFTLRTNHLLYKDLRLILFSKKLQITPNDKKEISVQPQKENRIKRTKVKHQFYDENVIRQSDVGMSWA